MGYGTEDITILAGGPAGLSVGYYARKNGLSFTIYEANNRVGGNCVTLKQGDFLFDSGAHRLHDKDEEVTEEVKNLLGDELHRVSAPSQIFFRGQYIDFPLSPLDLLKKIGPFEFSRAGLSFAKARVSKSELDGSFESLALYRYGRSISEKFLLNYSEKLWGLPCNQLSPNISGKRLKGLDLRTFLIEATLGKLAKTQHLDGSFYYPKMGYGRVVERMEEFCGPENMRLNHRINRLTHNGRQIQAVGVDGSDRLFRVNQVVSTLPLSLLIRSLDPAPPAEILRLANSLRYRHLRLVALFLDKPSINGNATVYFPEKTFPFTRIYEPRNRSPYMSPPGKTSLVVEIPCHREDAIWSLDDSGLVNMITQKLVEIGWIRADEVLDSWCGRLNFAYPILELGFEDKVSDIADWLSRFDNLSLSGRNGKFAYTHLHDMMRFGKDIVEKQLALVPVA
ncbi:FAD-dependent oxidoreductase [Oscillatoria sp. CS-180]|uniref:FAD-dependent oxidoreductase n=1 Tax=Oscillatoria sp. CS-180 TaxID=3021720 RepID=UPI00232C230E|nr:FAD-dependent oxidoreductase [Oscillatoria sp. CS-180]MDB9529340.1 FAD-dependent oxidoreductase [Oscillatoria sp. CS-180]